MNPHMSDNEEDVMDVLLIDESYDISDKEETALLEGDDIADDDCDHMTSGRLPSDGSDSDSEDDNVVVNRVFCRKKQTLKILTPNNALNSDAKNNTANKFELLLSPKANTKSRSDSSFADAIADVEVGVDNEYLKKMEDIKNQRMQMLKQKEERRLEMADERLKTAINNRRLLRKPNLSFKRSNVSHRLKRANPLKLRHSTPFKSRKRFMRKRY